MGKSQTDRGQHIERLEAKIKRLSALVEYHEKANKLRNDRLYATGYIVRCTGCIEGGPDEPELLTEERIQEVERIAKRLRDWWNMKNKRIK